jgi:hypothetical protein
MSGMPDDADQSAVLGLIRETLDTARSTEREVHTLVTKMALHERDIDEWRACKDHLKEMLADWRQRREDRRLLKHIPAGDPRAKWVALGHIAVAAAAFASLALQLLRGQ